MYGQQPVRESQGAAPRPTVRVLIVDDEDSIRRLVSKWTDISGYEVKAASSAEGRRAARALGKSQTLYCCSIRYPRCCSIASNPCGPTRCAAPTTTKHGAVRWRQFSSCGIQLRLRSTMSEL